MRRRTFITLLGGAAAWPLAARAQQATTARIGFVRATSAQASAGLVDAFRRGLREAGFVEGSNVAIEYRWPDEPGQLPDLANDLVRRQCGVIIVGGNAPMAAVKAATQTIPIIFVTGED